jgi:DNA polymerase-3 subunit gamma/tau
MSICTDLPGKYRPQTFEELVGQAHITKVIEQHLKSGTLPRSLIFYGPAGVGKTSLARLIGTALNSHKSGTIEKDSAIAGKVDAIRTLQTELLHYPLEGEYKTYIFDEAHRISPAGFDSLLKTVEEPPEHVVFIFVTTNINQIPLTIRSRSEAHFFNRISEAVITDKLKEVLSIEKSKLPDNLLRLAVEAGNGSLRSALVALNQIITLYQNDEVEIEITKTLGIVSSTLMSKFVLGHILSDFHKVMEASALFNSEVIDPVKAMSVFQQFIYDVRLGLILPDEIRSMRSNVTPTIEEIHKLKANYPQLTDADFLRNIGARLDNLLEVSLDFEQKLRLANNKDVVVKYMVIRLAKTWYNA